MSNVVRVVYSMCRMLYGIEIRLLLSDIVIELERHGLCAVTSSVAIFRCTSHRWYRYQRKSRANVKFDTFCPHASKIQYTLLKATFESITAVIFLHDSVKLSMMGDQTPALGPHSKSWQP
jgi:hypothetical protein